MLDSVFNYILVLYPGCMKRCRLQAVRPPLVRKNSGGRPDGSRKKYKKLNLEVTPKGAPILDSPNDEVEESCAHFLDYLSCNVCAQLMDPEEDIWKAVKTIKALRKVFGNYNYMPEDTSSLVFLHVDLSGPE